MKQFTKIEIHKDTISSLLLFLGIISAMIISNNSLLLSYYRSFVHYKFTLGFGPFTIDKTTLKFINDGLMSLFFFFLGLEMKYHLTEGEFKEKINLILPIITAAGGFAVPALIYSWFNLGSTEGQIGWAIPVATDTAFVLAILYLIGDKLSNNAKIFVVGLSIIDDVLAISVLAIFYTPNLDSIQLILCSAPLAFLTILNLKKSSNRYLYYLGGLILWVFVVKSGVHGTLAGILLALFIPTKIELFDRTIELVKEIESSIHSLVAFVVLPLFAFVNCELAFKELSLDDIFSPISIGCFIGLLIGKPLGIFGSMMIASFHKRITLPQGITKLQFLGISCLCGIGFTLSLFIGLLAFESIELENQMKIGVLLASLSSALIGTFIIKFLDRE